MRLGYWRYDDRLHAKKVVPFQSKSELLSESTNACVIAYIVFVGPPCISLWTEPNVIYIVLPFFIKVSIPLSAVLTTFCKNFYDKTREIENAAIYIFVTTAKLCHPISDGINIQFGYLPELDRFWARANGKWNRF